MLEIGFENTYFQVFQGFPALGQNGQNGTFFKKAFGTFFSLIKALIKCKVSGKWAWTNERMNGGESKGHRLRRETKNQKNLLHAFRERYLSANYNFSGK